MSLAMNVYSTYIWHSKLCARLHGPMHARGIFVFRLQYNNNISCIPTYFLHASVPSITDEGQIILGRMEYPRPPLSRSVTKNFLVSIQVSNLSLHHNTMHTWVMVKGGGGVKILIYQYITIHIHIKNVKIVFQFNIASRRLITRISD
jgi:hypothetical protein